MRIKTNVRELIARLEERKRHNLEAYAEAAAAYPAREAAYRERVIAGLERELARVKAGRSLPHSYGHYSGNRRTEGVIVRVGVMPPSKPRRPDHRAVNRRIAELRLCSQDDIVIDPTRAEWSALLLP